jgi:integrase
MAHLRKHGKKWQAVVRKKNKLIYKSFWKKSDASAWAYKTEAQLETGTYQRVERAEKLADIKLKEILNIYYEKYLVLKSKDHKKEKYLIDLLSNKPIGEKYLTEVTGSTLARFRDRELEDGKSPSTVKKYLLMFSRAINRTKAEHDIPIINNPVQQIELPEEPPPVDRVLNDEEWDRLLEVAASKKPYFMKAIVIMARETLCRRGELLRLKKQDINWRQGTAKIKLTKNNTPREIGLSPLALQTLRQLPDTPDGRFFPCKSVYSFNSYWRKVLRDAKLKGVFTFHRLRHQGATDLAESDWSIAELSAQGGWKSLSSLKRYTHIQPKHLANKLKKKGEL